MELSQGQIIKKPNKQELSSMFITHPLNVMHASVNFHKYTRDVRNELLISIWRLQISS